MQFYLHDEDMLLFAIDGMLSHGQGILFGQRPILGDEGPIVLLLW